MLPSISSFSYYSFVEFVHDPDVYKHEALIEVEGRRSYRYLFPGPNNQLIFGKKEKDCPTGITFQSDLPEATYEPYAIFTDCHNVTDTCTMVGSGEQFHVVACAHGEDLKAFSQDSKHVKWHIHGSLQGTTDHIRVSGVTSDDRGNLFVCDFANKCVHLFKAEDGTHLGVLLRQGEAGLGVSRKVGWCCKASTLVIAHVISEQVKEKQQNIVWLAAFQLNIL